MTITMTPYTSSKPEPGASMVRSIATMHELRVEDVIAQVVLIQQVMASAMKQDEHYGVIPGTGTKPSLLKPGAEKLCLLFRLDPQYEVVETRDGNHLTVQARCILYHIPTGNRMGSGMGSCSTKESKYAYRQAKRQCPKCGAEAINKSKFPPKDKRMGHEPGWYCYTKAGGCGLEFAAGDGAILNQPLGRVANPDLPDQWNTVLKMACKRALVDAVLKATAASDIFTQDLEDYPMAGAPTPKVESPESVPVHDAGSPPDDLPDEEPTMAAPSTAPFEEWLQALSRPTNGKGLQALWKGCTAPDLWKTWNTEQQAQLIEAKNEAKRRLNLD